MKKFIKCFVVILFLFSIFNFTFSDTLPSIDCEAALLIDADSGKVLFEKNADKQMYPASVTKLLTAILAVENCDLNETAIASKEAIMSVPTRIYTCKYSNRRRTYY